MSQLHVSRPREGVVLIEIDAPPSNALNFETRKVFEAELDAIEQNFDVRCVIITGRGAGFCAGDDLREVGKRDGEGPTGLGQFGRLLDKIERLRAPVIAAVNGYAIGGGLELALCCDIRIASEKAFFLGAGVNVGLMASVYRLPRLIGVGPAKAMLLTGARTTAETALRYGLVTAIYAADALMSEALALAKRIATRAPLSVEASKRMIGQAFDLNPEEAGAASGRELSVLTRSSDHKEGVRAFLAKAEPKFTRS